MLKREDNERLVRVGPGTPMGVLLRRYWQPVLLSWELKERDGAPVRVCILGEELVAFRATDGRIGLVDAYCRHRRAPLFYGRNEESKGCAVFTTAGNSMLTDNVSIYPTWRRTYASEPTSGSSHTLPSRKAG